MQRDGQNQIANRRAHFLFFLKQPTSRSVIVKVMILSERNHSRTKLLKDGSPTLSSQHCTRQKVDAQHYQLHEVLPVIHRREIEQKNLHHNAIDPKDIQIILPLDESNSLPTRYPTVRTCNSAENSELTPIETAGRLTATILDNSDMPTCSPSIEEHQSFFPSPAPVSHSANFNSRKGKF